MNFLEKLKINRAISYLKNLNPQKLEAYSQKRAVQAFHYVYRNSKVYNYLIRKAHRLNYSTIIIFLMEMALYYEKKILIA